MKIAIAGSSGLIGKALTGHLISNGHQVLRILRGENKNRESAIYWNPSRKLIDKDTLEGLDAIINLCGEGIANKRWSKNQKKLIKSSRLDSTKFLVENLALLKSKPRILISASAIGFYGNSIQGDVTEDSPAGQGFLPELCQQWEQAAHAAKDLGIRVVTPRIGIVLTSKGGALAKMLLPFKLAVGGPIGSGLQYMSWVSLTDLLSAFSFLIEQENIDGAVNLTASSPVTNEKFSRALASVLRRPCFFRVPSFLIKATLGEMGNDLLLEGAKVLPNKLLENGFIFKHTELSAALQEEIS